jgi:hypothetical protein
MIPASLVLLAAFSAGESAKARADDGRAVRVYLTVTVTFKLHWCRRP